MGRPLRIEYRGAFYYITARGNQRQPVFGDDADRLRFLEYFESSTERYGARIHAYCLLDNHYHLLLETPRANLAQIMHHINGAYTNYFNARYGRCGHLFQGRYMAILVEKERYALALSRHIHLNPVRVHMVARLERYGWSSYAAYADQADGPDWLYVDYLRNQHDAYVEYVSNEGPHGNPLQDVFAASILGSRSFIDEVKQKYLDRRSPSRDLPALRCVRGLESLDQIRRAVALEFDGSEPQVRQVEIYLCHKYSGHKLKDIGVLFGVGESAVTQSSARFRQAVRSDPSLQQRVERLESLISTAGDV